MLRCLGAYVIAGDNAGAEDESARSDLKRPWKAIKKRARLAGIRLHDLRHTHASFGAAGGFGLPVIGKLLGHKQAATTARYAHLDVDPLRRASEHIGSRIAAAMGETPNSSVSPPKERVRKMMRRTKAQLIVSLDRPRPHVVGGKGSIWFAEQETMPIFLPEMIGLERYYVPIQTIPLTSSDWVQLKKGLGAAISNKYRKLIEHALAHLVASYCFKDRVPKLGELRKRVQEIKDASERLLELGSPTPVDTVGKQKRTQRSITRGIARHVLSTDKLKPVFGSCPAH